MAFLFLPENTVRLGATSRSPITISQVPDPGTLLSMAWGLATLVIVRRHRPWQA